MTAPYFGSTLSDHGLRSTAGIGDYFATAGTTRSDYGGGFSVTNYTDYFQSPQQTARTSGAVGFTRRIATGYTSGNTLGSALNSSGVEGLRIRSIGARQFQLQYWNGASYTGIGSGITVPGGATDQYRFVVDFTGLGGAGGTLQFRVVLESGEAIVGDESATGLNLTSVVNVDRLRLYCGAQSGATYGVSEWFIKDGSGLTAYVYNNKITGNGTDVDGTGSYTDMDDTNISTPDVDFVSLSASGNRRSAKAPARNFGGRAVKGVGFGTRLRRGATGPTQIKAYLTIGGTRYYWGGGAGTAVTLTTVYTDYWFGWELDPSTGVAWTAANAQSANLEFGVEVV